MTGPIQPMNPKIQRVNEILLRGEPDNISVDDHASSTYTGYKPQSVVDAMNEVFWGEWGFVELSNEIHPGEKGGIAVAKVEVWVEGNKFHPTGWGQNRVTRGDIGDAQKGAQTDAIKKALSYYSIGNRAYHGLLPNNKEQTQQARQSTNNRAPQQGRSVKADDPKQKPQPNIDGKPTQQAAKQIDKLAIDVLRRAAERYVSGGWSAVRSHLIQKYDLGDIPDDSLTTDHRRHAYELIEATAKASRQGTTSGK